MKSARIVSPLNSYDGGDKNLFLSVVLTMLNAISPVGTLPSFTQENIFLTSSSHKRPEPGAPPFSEYTFFGRERRVLGMVNNSLQTKGMMAKRREPKDVIAMHEKP